MSGDATESRLVVAIRPRPLSGGVPPDGALRFDCGTANAVACASASGAEDVLQFDRVFAPDARNDDVYTAVAQPVVKAALRGINGAVAAYGQTSSGKTHTMRGTADDPGIVPRAVRVRTHAVAATGVSALGTSLLACGRGLRALAACLSAAPEARLLTRLVCCQVEEVFAYVGATPEREFSLSLAYLEIYNENVRDLLNPAAKLDVYEGLQGVEVKNCKPTPVGDVAAVRGRERRRERTLQTDSHALRASTTLRI